MRKLETNTGRMIDCTFAGLCQMGILYVCVENMTAGEVATIFTSKEETAKLTLHPNEGENALEYSYENYSVFVDMFPEGAGYRVGLRRPYVGEEI